MKVRAYPSKEEGIRSCSCSDSPFSLLAKEDRSSPPKFLPVEKIGGGKGREKGKKRGNDFSRFLAYHSHYLRLEHRVSFAFPFELSIPFAFPHFPSFFTGSSLSLSLSLRARSRNKNNGERFLGLGEPQRKAVRCRSVNTCAKRRGKNKRGGKKKEGCSDGLKRMIKGYRFVNEIFGNFSFISFKLVIIYRL